MNKQNSLSDKQSLPIGQKGITPILILVAFAAIAVIGIIAFGFFTLTKNTQKSPLPSSTPFPSPQLQAPLGTPDCPELDYTGCDTSGDFMTWNDDGLR